MAGIVHKEFAELAQTWLNYLSWSSDCEIFLQGKTLLRAISKGPSWPPLIPSSKLRMRRLCTFSVITCHLL